MSALGELLSAHWSPALLLGVGLAALAVLALLRRRLGTWCVPLAAVAGGLGMLGAGGLGVPASWGWWVLGAGALVLAGMVVLLLLAGAWWAPLAWASAAVLLLGAGALWTHSAGEGLAELARNLRGTEFVQPWWLLLLAVVPLIVLLALPRLNREEYRPWVAMFLRCTLVALLAVALAEPRFRQQNDRVTVLFVVDRSQSIPEELVDNPAQPGTKTDLRLERIRDFINASVEQRGARHARDKAGLIVFGRRPRLELPPSDVPRFNLTGVPPASDGTYTDIAAAVKLALASFPEGAGKRIVLISDGNENLGDAAEQARLAQTLGVQIDVLPLAAGQKNEDEVLVERVDAPPVIEQGSRVPIRVLVRSFNPHIVVGRLTVRQITEGDVRPLGEPLRVKLRLGLNPFSFTRPLTDEQRSYTYEAEFQPEWVEDENGKVLQNKLPGDRVQNNRASAHVLARGQKGVLILENQEGDCKFLADALLAAGKAKYKLVVKPVGFLGAYKDRDRLAVLLSNFDCVVLANVAADQLSEEQQEVIRSNTHDQGCGLVMVGGPDAYGAGGWQNTPVEKALPVDSEIKSLKVQGKGGLVLIMHASEMADGNMWQKKIAKLAVERLGPADEVGVIDFGIAGHQWVVPMQEIGNNRGAIMGKIDQMTPGDMPDFDPALKMAHAALTDPKRGLSTKHVIIISDGDPGYTPGVLAPMKRAKVTVTTVGVATHGATEDQKMALIAKTTGGRSYSVKDPRQLPAIYIKESRVVSQSFIQEKRFQPLVAFRSGPTDRLPDPVPPLRGFVRTTPKPSPLVEIPMLTPRFADQDFPLLAYWHYGLGKAVAFTSDAGDPKFWSREWAEGGGGRGGMYAKFWEQVIDWSLRPTESKRLSMTTEYRDGKIRVVVEARTRDEKNPGREKPDTDLRLRAGVTGPGGRPEEAGRRQNLRFVQKNSGRYELEIKAEEAGSYFITAQATRLRKVKGRDGQEHEIEEGVDSVRTGVTLPYSPEFSELESNTALLDRLRELTGGRSYADDTIALAEAAKSGEVFRPAPARLKSMQSFWHWLVFWSCFLLLCDVAVRRLALDPEGVTGVLARAWARLRGQPLPPPREEFHERLHSRQARVRDELARAGRRFEGAPGGAAPPVADPTAPPPPTRPAAGPAAPAEGAPSQPEPEAGDFASRLLQAKKKVWEERKKEDGQ